MIVCKDPVNSSFEIFTYGNGMITFRGATDVNSSTTISSMIGSWHQVVGTYDGSTMKIYIDGALEGSTSITNAIHTTAGDIEIGNGDHGTNGFNGLIDEVRIYNRALSS